jgi:hypothetical protein
MLLYNEFTAPGVRNQCFDGIHHGIAGPECQATAGQILEGFSMAKVHKWNNAAVMIAFFVTYRLFFYTALRFVSRQTRK